MSTRDSSLLLALPKGRILPKACEFLASKGIHIDTEQLSRRKLIVDTNLDFLQVSVIRNSDILLSITNGACDLAIAGSDMLQENMSTDYYDLLDLGIAKCSLKVAAPVDYVRGEGRVRVATKFENLTKTYYASKGIECQVVKLNGAMELAVHIGLADEIVDLVETGKTLKENNMQPVDTVLDVSSHLIANCDRTISKHHLMNRIITQIEG